MSERKQQRPPTARPVPAPTASMPLYTSPSRPFTRATGDPKDGEKKTFHPPNVALGSAVDTHCSGFKFLLGGAEGDRGGRTKIHQVKSKVKT